MECVFKFLAIKSELKPFFEELDESNKSNLKYFGGPKFIVNESSASFQNTIFGWSLSFPRHIIEPLLSELRAIYLQM
jgi:hypothetical protein